jgi:DNA-binding XRE family transcriptional regulator
MDWVIDKNLEAMRIELGLTQLDVAILLGISRVTYIKWEQQPLLMPIGKYEELMVAYDNIRELKAKE